MLERPATPPYVIRETTRINQLECTVQRIANDLSSSKDQIMEVKELLLRLINPQAAVLPSPAAAVFTQARNCSPDNSGIAVPPRTTEEAMHINPPLRNSEGQSTPSDSHNNSDRGILLSSPLTHVNVTNGSGAVEPSYSCPSGDTVPVTPNTLLQNFTNHMPVGGAVSAEVSASIRTAGADHSPHPSIGNSVQYTTSDQRPLVNPPPIREPVVRSNETGPSPDGVSTRRQLREEESAEPVRGPRPRFELGLSPRITDNPVAANCQCFILHPDKYLTIVAEGRTGGSWKSPSQKLGNLCHEGEQMVQVHKIIVPNLRLLFIEERQPFTLLDHALVKSSGSSVYVKWKSNLLVKKAKACQAKKTQ